MNILFLVSRYPEKDNETILEKDLVRVFNEKGHKCFVGTIIEKKYNKPTYEFDDRGIKVLKVKTGNMFDVKNPLEKGITVTTLPFQISKEIIKKYGNKKIDLIIAYSPFMSNPQIVTKLKKEFNCKSLMIMWDIFPQNAWDLGIIKNKMIFNYFKYKEHKMLKTFNYIACNSEGNIDYLLDNYSFIEKKKLLLVRNCEYSVKLEDFNRKEIRERYDFKENEVIFIFGGNMGVPQQLENIINLAKKVKDEPAKFLFIGNGTEKNRLKELSKNNLNIKFLDFVPREDYENLLRACDVGLISLNKNYTVPNFPAKVTGYTKLGLPILASLDESALNDLGELIVRRDLGIVIPAKNIDNEGIEKNLLALIKDKNRRKTLSLNCKKFYKEELQIGNSYKKIEEKILVNIK